MAVGRTKSGRIKKGYRLTKNGVRKASSKRGKRKKAARGKRGGLFF